MRIIISIIIIGLLLSTSIVTVKAFNAKSDVNGGTVSVGITSIVSWTYMVYFDGDCTLDYPDKTYDADKNG